MTCPQCGRPHDAGAKFCRGCGARVESAIEAASSTCATCQAPLKPGARFCKQCGTASAVVAAVAAEPAVDIAQPMAEPDPQPEVVRVAAEPDPQPEVVRAEAEPSVSPAARFTPERKPAVVASTGSSRGIVIAASVVLGVVVVGGLVTWGFLRKGDMPASTAAPVVAEAASQTPAATKPDIAPVLPLPPASPAPVTQAPVTEAAPATLPVAAPAEPVPAAEAPAASVEPVQHTPPAPVETPARVKRAAAPVEAQATLQDVALNLVRKGESAFSRQDYSTAIANARAALDVNPKLARAKQLLDEAQHAQQQAMSSISIQ